MDPPNNKFITEGNKVSGSNISLIVFIAFIFSVKSKRKLPLKTGGRAFEGSGSDLEWQSRLT